MRPVSDLEVGRAAEYLVCADLILQGFPAFLSDQGLCYDVAVEFGGRLLRVQVKGTRCQRNVPQRVLSRPGYLFQHRRSGKGGCRQYAPDSFDLLAFVALDIRAVAYLTAAEAPNGALILRPPGQEPAPHATRRENIDQLPFEAAARRLAADRAAE